MSHTSEALSPSTSTSSAKNWVKHAGPRKPTPPILLDASTSSSHVQMSSASDACGTSLYTSDKVIEELKQLAQSMLLASKEARERVKLGEESDPGETYSRGSNTSDNFSKSCNDRDTEFDEILQQCTKNSDAIMNLPRAYNRTSKSNLGLPGRTNLQEVGEARQAPSSEAVGESMDLLPPHQCKYIGRGEEEKREMGSLDSNTMTRAPWKAIIPISNEWTDKGGGGKGKGRASLDGPSTSTALGTVTAGRTHPSGEGKLFSGGGGGASGECRAKGGGKVGNSLHNDPEFLLNMEGSGFLGVRIPPLLANNSSSSGVPSSSNVVPPVGTGAGGGVARRKKNTTFSAAIPQASDLSSSGTKEEVDDDFDELNSSDTLEGFFDQIPEAGDEPGLVITKIRAKELHLFERMSSSFWTPEPIARYEDGFWAGRWDPKEEDNSSSDEKDSEAPSSITNVVPLSDRSAGKNLPSKRGGDGDREAMGKSTIGGLKVNGHGGESPSLHTDVVRKGNVQHVPLSAYRDRFAHPSQERRIKTFRVPLFPFGGGVCAAQLLELTMLYERFGKRISTRPATRPSFIRKKDFCGGKYTEITATDHRYVPGIFQPESSYDFVVEVEKNVVFDPMKAKRKRQDEIRRLAKERGSPSTLKAYPLKVIMDSLETGFPKEEFPISPGDIIVDRYRVKHLIANSTFSRTVRCVDLWNPIYNVKEIGMPEVRKEAEVKAGKESSHTRNGNSRSKGPRQPEPGFMGFHEVCLKIIHNKKEFFDQSLDEIKILRLINEKKDPDEVHVLRFFGAFYYMERCILVTEMLSDSLYEHSKFNRECEDGAYFSIPRLKRIARQVVMALEYIHSLNLVHADLKPENILFVSLQRCIVKVVDFGNTTFLSDYLSSYIQTRSYRAPEAIFGCDYDGRIDVWSFGAILMELITGEVLFAAATVPEMLGRIVLECGRPFPRRMLWEGRYTHRFITKFGAIYEIVNTNEQEKGAKEGGGKDHKVGNRHMASSKTDEEVYYIYTPQPAVHPQRFSPSTPLQQKKSDMAKQSTTRIQEEGDSDKANEFIYHHKDGSFISLRKKMVAAGVVDYDFADFVEQCLNLNHKKRMTSRELLEHPFIRDISL